MFSTTRTQLNDERVFMINMFWNMIKYKMYILSQQKIKLAIVDPELYRNKEFMLSLEVTCHIVIIYTN